MDLLNVKVRHKKWGEGIITIGDNGYFTVKFDIGEKKFVYPEAFTQGYLQVEDIAINERALADMKIKLEEKEKAEQQERIERERREQEKREQEIVKRKKTVKIGRQNVAFKCNYCDGGRSASRVGFFGPCSVENINHNILVDKHEWCSKGSKCKEFLEGKIVYSDIQEEFKNCSLCYESVMLQKWRAEAGIIGTGINKGKPMRMEKVQVNSLAVLTTRLPNSSEEDRFVFAAFLVDEAYEGDNREAGYVTTNSKWKIELTPEESSKILFWNYYRCPNATDVIRFGSGLHRYLSDVQAAQILRDIAEVKTDIKEKEFAKEFFEEFCDRVGIDADNLSNNDGALCSK